MTTSELTHGRSTKAPTINLPTVLQMPMIEMMKLARSAQRKQIFRDDSEHVTGHLSNCIVSFNSCRNIDKAKSRHEGSTAKKHRASIFVVKFKRSDAAMSFMTERPCRTKYLKGHPKPEKSDKNLQKSNHCSTFPALMAQPLGLNKMYWT